MPSYRVLLFSVLRERVGSPTLEILLGEQATVADLVALLFQHHPEIAGFDEVLKVAVNLEYADRDRALRPGDEVALITPTSGG